MIIRNFNDLLDVAAVNTIFLEGPAQLGKSHLAKRLARQLKRKVYTTFGSMVSEEQRVGSWRTNIANMFGFGDQLWEGGLYALDAFAQTGQTTIIDRCYLSNVVYQGNKKQLPLFKELFERVHGLVVLVFPRDRFDWERRYNRLDISSDVELFPEWFRERLDHAHEYREIVEDHPFPYVIYQGET